MGIKGEILLIPVLRVHRYSNYTLQNILNPAVTKLYSLNFIVLCVTIGVVKNRYERLDL